MTKIRCRWRDGRWVDRDGLPLLNQSERAGPVARPMLLRDFDSNGREYASPIDGKMITSRSERREDLKRNNCYEVDPPKEKRGFKNRRFCEKWGLRHRDDM